MKGVLVSLLAFGVTYLFFYEYLPPAKRVHFVADVEGYHYPLLNYAFKSLRQGRVPEWDPSIYCGLSYVGNVQAGLFYPPNWLLFYANRKHTGLRFTTVEMLEIFHYWLAFVLAWRWLRRHTRGDLPAILGAAVFGFSGYIMAESQHLGVICGYAWYPLGLLSIDEASDGHDYRRLWKLAIALALCLLAGYPTTWIVFCFAAATYALIAGGWRIFLQSLGAIAFSSLLAAVQLAPTYEIASIKTPEITYGVGIAGGAFFYTGYFTPNYYDQSGKTVRWGPADENYNYLGSSAILALITLLALRRWRQAIPGLLLLSAALWIILDPGHFLNPIITRLPFIREITREWNFMGMIAISAALLTAVGLDAFAAVWRRRLSWWLVAPFVIAWSIKQWLIWLAGANFVSGWWTMGEAAAHLIVLLLAFSVKQPAARTALVLLAVFVEYKVYGTSRRFNSDTGSVDVNFSRDMRTGGDEMTGVDNIVFAEMSRHPEYRVMYANASPAGDLRHYGLTSPQGFEPFLPPIYMETVGEGFESNRLFKKAPDDTAFYDNFAVRYLLTVSGGKEDQQLATNPRFLLRRPADRSYFRVYEYLQAKPAYRLSTGLIQAIHWEPERRTFRVRSENGGDVHLIEQLLPGWEATVDGKPVQVFPARGAFQGISVPAGSHEVEFRYRSRGLRIGAPITLVSLLVVALIAFQRSRSPAL